MQSDQSITRKHGGTGLGTSFAREILRLMGGDISLSSVVGLGTKVLFSIPFHKSEMQFPLASMEDVTIAVLAPRAKFQMCKEWFASYDVGQLFEYQTTADLIAAMANAVDSQRIDALFVDADSYGHFLPTIPAAIADLHLTHIIPLVGIGSAALRTVAVSSGYCSFVSTEGLDTQLPSSLALVQAFCKRGGIAPAPGPTQIASRALNILVADDNATNRKIAKIALEEAGHKCTLVTNGDEALFALNDTAFDAALLDMHMPGRDGIEVAKIYRFAGFDRGAPIPIILLTADSTREAREEAESAGISRFLTKPILPSEIVRTVELVVEEFDRDNPRPTSAERASPDEKTVAIIQSTGSNTAPEETSEIINLTAIGELISLMSKAEQREFFGEFCEDAHSYIGVLEAVSSASDVTAARDAMHALAGAALIIGANHLAQIARNIEKAEAGSIVMNRTVFLGELRQAFDSTAEELYRLSLSPRH